jgi:uncharacterized protein
MPVLFSEPDLDRLESWLHAPERRETAMPLDAVQGFLCAVLSAPNPIPDEAWIGEILGEGGQFTDQEERDEITGLLMRFRDFTAQELGAGEGLNFIHYEDEDDGQDDLAWWSEGYLSGVELADPSWDEGTDPDDIDEMLFPMMVLSGRLKDMAEEEGEPWDEETEKRMMSAARNGLADTVFINRQFWFEKSIPGTMRRDSPKVGRNDPCPCGSGKKYKNCCGQ